MSGAVWRVIVAALLGVSVVLIYTFTCVWLDAAVTILSGYFVFQGALCGVALGDFLLHTYGSRSAMRPIKSLIIVLVLAAEVGPILYLIALFSAGSVQDGAPLMVQLMHDMYADDAGMAVIVLQIIVVGAILLAQLLVALLQVASLCAGYDVEYLTTILMGCATLYIFIATSLWTQYASFVYQGTLVLTGVIFGLSVINQMLAYVTTANVDLKLRSAYYTTVTAALALFGPVFALAQIAGAGLTTPDDNDTIINQLAHHMIDKSLGATLTFAALASVLVIGNFFTVVAYGVRAANNYNRSHRI